MKKIAIVLVSLSLLGARYAHAEPQSYVSVGGEVGNVVGTISETATVGGGYRLDSRPLYPLYLHAQLATGMFSDLSEAIGGSGGGNVGFYHGQGRYLQARAGVESLRCTTRGMICAVAGADLGVLRTGMTSGPFTDTPSARYTQEQVIPRVGLDVGGERLRLRTTVELAVGATQRESMSTTTSDLGAQAVTVGAAVAYRF
jgi:hypothetical protein